ncbi:SixA phosphatase family protein [Sphingorhabdus arenilitoris]|uniref:SixA phosphatase family protein n=1 Tax=Sphingorhabdus arenilitoris TaxID=1490041 RepID=A0ABV8RKH9_9SPHN
MKTLTLLRHAKSSWDDPVARDFDRPLNKKGERAARVMGQYMRSEKLVFDHVVASPAIRVIETIDHVGSGYGKRIEPKWERRIYLASSATLMDVLREMDDGLDHILMLGHNPGMEDLILDLVPEQDGDLRASVYAKYPTAALAQIAIDIDHWAEIDRGTGSLKRFIRPRDLDPELGPDDEY